MPTAAASTSSAYMLSPPSLIPFSEKCFISLSASAHEIGSERVVRVNIELTLSLWPGGLNFLCKRILLHLALTHKNGYQILQNMTKHTNF
jgi:hypothetical protein